MNENDLIAEYVKENMPEILDSFGFRLWKAEKTINKLWGTVQAMLEKIDFCKL